MRQQSVMSGHKAVTARPLSPGATAFGKMLSRAWSLPPQRNRVAVERDIQVPMSDGTVLLADHYLPVSVASAATVLVRCPYGRSGPFALQNAQILAERGYHVLLQSCRGTFGSGGEFEPMRHEIADGHDTVAWLREQGWFEGRLATYGASYLGFVQWALAMDPPPELVAAIVHIGPHDFSRTAFRNGVFDLYNYVSWSDLVAHQESTRALPALVRLATAERRLRPVLDRLPVEAGFRDLLGREPTSSERWLEHPQLRDPFWAPLQCGAALERITVPVLVVGGWHDLFIEQTLEQYRTLAARDVPTRLLVGPWAHLDLTNKGAAAVVESLAWLDRYASPGKTGPRPASAGAAHPDHSVRIWVGGEGAGEWREIPGWRRPAPRSSAGTSAHTARLAPESRPRMHRPPASATTRPTLRRRRAARSWPGPGGAATTGPSSSAWTCWCSAASRCTSRSRSSERSPPSFPSPATTPTPTCSCGYATWTRAAGRGTSATASCGSPIRTRSPAQCG